MDVAIVGAGVSGLTCGVVLRERGIAADILTIEPPSATTSAAAGAIWYPYGVERSRRVADWSVRTLERLTGLNGDPASGLHRRPLLEVFSEVVADPWWAGLAPGFGHAGPAELPVGRAHGWRFDTIVIHVPTYLGWLEDRFSRGGGAITVDPDGVEDLAGVAARVVVNCTGVGAHGLVPDHDVVPVSGQVVRIANPGIERCLIEDYGHDDIAYIFPRGSDCILGGTLGRGDWDRRPESRVTEQIVQRCAELDRRVAGAEILESLKGLRPTRPAIRLEVEHRDGASIVHDYGHGGSGYSVSWGCAEDVADLVQDALG